MFYYPDDYQFHKRNFYKLPPMNLNDKQKEHYYKLVKQLEEIFNYTKVFLAERDAHYESSWKKRGGVGAFMTIVRPWDRLHAIIERNEWDIFKVLQDEIDQGKTEDNDGTVHACLRDLMCYMALLLVEAKQMRQVYSADHLPPENT